MESILVKYFWSGMSYKNILVRLKTIHGLKRSLSWLKKKFRQLGLKRRGYCEQNPLLMKNIIARYYYAANEVSLPYWCCPEKKEKAKEKSLLQQGAKLHLASRWIRQIKTLWYSRKVIWFTLASTNNDPLVILRYFLEAIENICGCPAIVRADFGTENCRVAKTQIALRMHHSDEFAGKKSFIYGPSTSNIRIEAFWLQCCRSICDWCKSLVEEGAFNRENLLHRLNRYTLDLIFGNLLRCDMQEFMGDWNNHMIRRNKLSNSPSGRPQDLYDLPELQGVSDHKMPIDPNIWARCMLEESIKAPPLCPEDFAENALFFLERYFGMSLNDITHSNCKQVYISLVNLLSHCLS